MTSARLHRGVYPGTFDPLTLGHMDIISRAKDLFDELVISVADARKGAMFDIDERVEMAREATANLEGVRVTSFNGLLVDHVRGLETRYVVRGLRAVSDFEFELSMALTNRTLDPEFDTIFMVASSEYIFLSASVVREVATLGGDVSKMVPPCVADRLSQKLPKTTRP